MKISANDYDFRLFIIKYDLNVRYPGGMSAEKNSGCEMPFPLTSGCMILCVFIYLF